jgi:hypothetical protein
MNYITVSISGLDILLNEEAEKAYNLKVKELHGEFRVLNEL